MADYDKVIPPGQTGKITAKMNTKNYRGKETKSITVVSNDPETPRLSLIMKCTIMGVKVLPAARAYFTAEEGTSSTQELTVATIGEGAIAAHVIASKPSIIAKLEKLSEDPPANKDEYWNQYKLYITIPENAPPERFAESITLATDSEYDPQIKIVVAGVVNPSVIVTPSSVRMRLGGDNSETKIITVAKKKGAGLKITKIITDPPQLQFSLKETQKGKNYKISLTWLNSEKKGTFDGKIFIHTNDKIRPRIDVPVHIIVE